MWIVKERGRRHLGAPLAEDAQYNSERPFALAYLLRGLFNSPKRQNRRRNNQQIHQKYLMVAVNICHHTHQQAANQTAHMGGVGVKCRCCARAPRH